MPNIPAEIRPMLNAYLDTFHAQLPDLLDAFFLFGSIALGAFQPEWSDIDAIAITKRPLNETEFKILNQLHQELIITYDKWQLEVSYFLAEDLGQETHPPRPNFHEGQLSMGSFEANDITWWILKHQGIALYGDLPEFPVDWERLLHKMHVNMNTYWKNFTSDPFRVFWVYHDSGIQWVILGTLRQYYTFCENAITSKVGAGEYGLVVFPQWQRIIQEALNLRQNQPSLYRNKFRRAFDAWQFLHFIIKASNER